ncbi:hypothetical protein JTE90_009477 [Oedothorax gibbosus]|uniref:Uncharacterized protein n=1 Tax=Oedothorax gibbosus TaxID=931172 RepID=A0AAV6VW03_9ARAC|nr:hypothetical protein JTE90_009477 [Oedothorax gibbosus]
MTHYIAKRQNSLINIKKDIMVNGRNSAITTYTFEVLKDSDICEAIRSYKIITNIRKTKTQKISENHLKDGEIHFSESFSCKDSRTVEKCVSSITVNVNSWPRVFTSGVAVETIKGQKPISCRVLVKPTTKSKTLWTATKINCF